MLLSFSAILTIMNVTGPTGCTGWKINFESAVRVCPVDAVSD